MDEDRRKELNEALMQVNQIMPDSLTNKELAQCCIALAKMYYGTGPEAPGRITELFRNLHEACEMAEVMMGMVKSLRKEYPDA